MKAAGENFNIHSSGEPQEPWNSLKKKKTVLTAVVS